MQKTVEVSFKEMLLNTCRLHSDTSKIFHTWFPCIRYSQARAKGP